MALRTGALRRDATLARAQADADAHHREHVPARTGIAHRVIEDAAAHHDRPHQRCILARKAQIPGALRQQAFGPRIGPAGIDLACER